VRTGRSARRLCEHVFVRWESQQVERDRERRLPRLGDDAVVRTFDAPEALDTRFHEVRAKSALNAVPKRSRMPFRWTINPYRGCSHACAYCLGPETQILMADGRTKPIAELRAGDEIYGTVRSGSYRRYVTTQVLAHWSTIKPAYRVTLADATELVASGDHRFLSNRGWKYVTGAECGSFQRPHLTTNNKLIGTGGFSMPPKITPDYRHGYLCGMIRGDGHVGSYSYTRPGRCGDVHRFRLALADLEALRRTRQYLSDVDVATREFQFAEAAGNARSVSAIRTSARRDVLVVQELIRWPRSPTSDWIKGFLAGIFDAEGSFSGCVRISNTDPEIIAWTTYCLRQLQVPHVIEDYGFENGLRCVRLRGGLKEVLRFFLTVDPAITRKRTFEGLAIKSDAELGVEAIEPLGIEIPMYDITTGTGDFIANGVVSHNCFARPTHTYLNLNAGRDFEREIVVKVNVPEVLRAELARPSWKREQVALGTNTDPYQWVESRYKLMPEIWQALLDADTPCSLVTKSPLALRDIDILQDLANGPGVTVFFSVPTLDERAWRETEPHTPSPRARLEGVRKMNEAGVPSGILIAPLMPGINDSPEEVGEILRIAEDAGAISAPAMALHLRPGVKEVFFEWMAAHRPDLIPRYEELYSRGAYVPSAEKKRIAGMVEDVRPPRRKRRPRPRPAADRPPRGRIVDPPQKQQPAAEPQATLF
jgi:DNA repair photolyase